MGWFKGREILTASAVFNLSGKLADRPNFRKTTVVGAVLNGSPSLGETLSKAYLNGPGTRLKRFHRWALENYGAIGVPGATKLRLRQVLPSYIRPTIVSETLRDDIRVLGIQMAPTNYSYWAEQEILEEFPQYLGTVWSSSIDPVTNLITINFFDSTSHTFIPTNFVQGATYIYASYSYTKTPTVLGEGMYIYRIGSGNPTLDALYKEESEPSEAFLAPIPVRINGEFLSDTFRPSTFNLANRACKKAFSLTLNDIIEKVAESEDVDDMDYVYIVFGAPANTQEQAAREYIFNFLENLAGDEVGSETEYVGWMDSTFTRGAAYNQWTTAWEEAPPPEGSFNPEPNPAVPPPEGPPSRPWRGIKIENPGGNTNYDVRISWNSISMQTGTGLAKPDAVVGEYWFYLGSPDITQLNPFVRTSVDAEEINEVWLAHQETAGTWRAVKIVGMLQRTYVFGNNYEELTLASQIGNLEENRESAFLFPIRYSTLEGMGLKDATQFATSCAFLQIHAYEIHIQRIYQTPIFSFIIFALVIAITAASGGFGAASVGVLGSNAAVGAALGVVSAASAAIVGAAVNAIAAMVLTAVITKVATAVFGEKLGAIIGMVASVIAVNGLTNLADTGTFAINFGALTRAETILFATSSVSNAVNSYLQAEIKNIARKSEAFQKSYESQLDEVAARYADEIGYGNGIIDPFQFLEMNQEFLEAPAEFLQRTLMTGSDIAELTMLMLSNFAETSLKLDGPK